VIGLDWRTPIDWGRAQLGDGVAVQGNLDPTALFYPRPELEKRICAVLDQAGGQPGISSTWGTAFCPKHRSRTCARRLNWSTNTARGDPRSMQNYPCHHPF
jgi:hypothetical protein